MDGIYRFFCPCTAYGLAAAGRISGMTVFRKLYDKCGYRYASYFFDGTGE